MVINKSLITGLSAIEIGLRCEQDDYTIAKTIVDMYNDNPEVTLAFIHKENVLACHKFFIDFHCQFFKIVKE